jgi:hypothetical protein
MPSSIQAPSLYAERNADRPIADGLRLVVLVGFVFWSAIYGVWPEFAYTRLIGFGSVAIYTTDIFIGLAIALGLSDLLGILLDRSRRGSVRIVAALIGLYFMYSIGVVLPSALLAGSLPTTTLRLMSGRFVVLLVPMTVGLLTRRPHHLNLLLAAPAIASIIPLVMGIFRTFTGQVVSYSITGDTRFRALWGGTSLLFAWPVLVLAWGKAKSMAPRVFAAIGVIGLLLANHRSSYIGLLAVLPIVIQSKHRVTRLLLFSISATAAAALLLLAVSSAIPVGAFAYSFTHLFDFESGTGADRLIRWRLAWDVFSHSPFNDVLWTPAESITMLRSDAYAAHNWMLEVGVAEGLIPLFLYVGIIGETIRGTLRVRREPVVAGVLAYTVFYVVFSLFNGNFYNLACACLLWMGVGILIHLAEQPTESPR